MALPFSIERFLQMTLLILGIILFIGVHMIRVVVPGFRQAMIAKLGRGGWGGLHSVMSIGSLAVLVWGYAAAPIVNLWFPPMGMNHLTVTLMLFASICLGAGLLPAGHIAMKTKHPVVLAVKIWALAHLLSNGDLRSVLLFVAFLAWGVVLRINYKRRLRAGEITPQAFVSTRFDAYAVVGGIALWALITFWLHEILIGVAPLAM